MKNSTKCFIASAGLFVLSFGCAYLGSLVKSDAMFAWGIISTMVTIICSVVVFAGGWAFLTNQE